ncbi:MAG TPA: IS3 family transposase [Fastidiosipila sp.]|nr:IS3 family transposase [Fastidiosipila sp.]
MSRKACTTGNAACEGFFGRLKNEMHFGYEWQKKSASQLMMAIDNYIRWYNTQRIKMSLGRKSPQQFRQDLGFTLN